MKQLQFLLLMVWIGGLATSVFGQTSSLVVFNEAKEDFTLAINGARLNPVPAQHVRVTGLQAGHYRVEAIFVSKALPSQVIGIQVNAGREISYALMHPRTSSGPFGFQFLSEYTTGYIPIAPQATVTVAYTGSVTDPKTIVQTQQAVDPKIQPIVIVPVKPNPLPGYTGITGCPYPMEPAPFDEAKKSIASKSFSDTKMQLAQQVTRNNCLLTSQILELMGLFSFESQKLEFAKFAYDFTYDKGNYYKVNEAFGFESSVRELEKYLQQK